MIIKLTVRDNDFSELLESFANRMFYLNIRNKLLEDMTTEEKSAEIDRMLAHEDILQLINPNNDQEITTKEAAKIIEYIKEQFADFLIGRKVSSSTQDYLNKNLQITIQKSFTDRWENGEMIYWLQHSHIVVNQ